MSLGELRGRLRNVHAFAVTPFRRGDIAEVDFGGLVKNLRFMAESGVEIINVGGGTGEVNALSVGELAGLCQTTLEAVGDTVLVLPTLPGNFKSALELAPVYEQMGAEAALAMAPYIRNRVPEDLQGVYEHYRAVTGASDLPILVYNTQGWPAEFFARLAEIDRIVGIKDPCLVPHNLFRAIKLLGDRFVWIGNKRHDPGVLQYRYQAGIEGFTAGLINFVPEYELELHRAALAQDWARMVDIQEQLAPLERLRGAHGDAAMVKMCMDLVGLSGGSVRPPRVDVSAQGRQQIREELLRLGLALA